MLESNQPSLGYEPNELPFLRPAELDYAIPHIIKLILANFLYAPRTLHIPLT